jgi:hypothetical protein
MSRRLQDVGCRMRSYVGVRDVDLNRLDKRKTGVGSPSHGTISQYLEVLIFCPTVAIRAKTRHGMLPHLCNGVPFDAFLTPPATYHSASHFGQRAFNRFLARTVRRMLPL